MLRSMFSAISGLRAHQVMMDEIGNNIANVNTVGYKTGRVNFQDILSQTFRGASAPQGGLGSINPAQVGLGVTVAGIDVIMTQGNLQSTGRLTDMAIQGDGFFVMSDGSREYYTRDGSFDIGLGGNLINPASGLKVQGWNADAAGAVDTTTAPGDVIIPLGTRTTALASATATITGNLDAAAAVGATSSTTLTMIDSLGVSHSVQVTFTKTGANAWDWRADTAATDTAASTTSTGTITFNSDGTFASSTGSPISLTLTNGATTPLDVAAVMDSMTGYQGASTLNGQVNGFTSGTLVTFTIGSGGDITGVFSNGQTQLLGQIAMASFVNAGGLLRQGQNLYAASSASGTASIGTPGTGGRGTVTTGSLEMSNVDLATQFTSMITAQRGFQANGKVITTSDEMLQDLVNLKR
ncbi:MAG: flagellar hook protein FlgE [Chloroflexota bacterium]